MGNKYKLEIKYCTKDDGIVRKVGSVSEVDEVAGTVSVDFPNSSISNNYESVKSLEKKLQNILNNKGYVVILDKMIDIIPYLEITVKASNITEQILTV